MGHETSCALSAAQIASFIADGFVIGSVIALGAIGVTLVYSILRFANFAHGELLTWGAYLAWTALLGFAAVWGPMEPLGPFSFGWTLLASLGVAAIATAALALLVDLLLFRQLRRHGSAITLIMASFGAAPLPNPGGSYSRRRIGRHGTRASFTKLASKA